MTSNLQHPDAESPVETVLEAIRFHCSTDPEAPAIVGSGGFCLTYGQLTNVINSCQSMLRTCGLGPSDRIVIYLEDRPAAVLATICVACAATAVPLDPRVSGSELRGLIKRLGASAFVLSAHSPMRGFVEGLDLVVFEAADAAPARFDLNPVVIPLPRPVDEARARQEDFAFVMQSSGTTGRAKLIPFTQGNMVAAARRLQTWFQLTKLDRCLNIAAPYYSHGLTTNIFTPLITGGSIAIPHTNEILAQEWLEELAPTWYSAAPGLHRAVLECAKSRSGPILNHRLRLLSTGGAPIDLDLAQELEAFFGVPVLDHYGMSEAAQLAASPPCPGIRKHGTCGHPFPNTLVVVDADGKPVPPNEVGSIFVRGPTLTPGYIDDPKLNEAHFSGGWFRTNDLGSLDSEGYLTLHGRVDDIINRGGEKVSPTEIERALTNHPAVSEAGVFAVPHPRLGQDVHAAVVLRSGYQLDGSELRRYLFRKLAPFKVPRHLGVVSALPKGQTGKLLRQNMQELVEAIDRSFIAAAIDTDLDPMSLEYELLARWRHLLKMPCLTIDDDFFESGGDSLLALEMLIEIDSVMDPNRSSQILLESPSIRQFAPRLLKHMVAASNPLIRMNAEHGNPPIIFFHGDFMAGGLYVHRLAGLLGSHQPLFVVAPHGLPGEEILGSIEEMACDRARLIMSECPQRRVFIGGHCNGALVAYEVARILKEEGYDVMGVFMVDPPTVNARAIPRKLLRLVDIVWPRRLPWFFELLVGLEVLSKKRWVDVLKWSLKSKPRRPKPLSWHAYTKVMARYQPTPMDLPVHFYSADFDGRGWLDMTTKLEIINVAGGHAGCVTICAPELVAHIKRTVFEFSAGLSDR